MIISNIFTRILFASVFLPSFSSAARKEVTKQQRQCLAWQQACSLLIKQWDISWPFGFHSSECFTCMVSRMEHILHLQTTSWSLKKVKLPHMHMHLGKRVSSLDQQT